MPVYVPKSDMTIDMTGLDDSSLETYHSTWVSHGKMEATLTFENQPSQAELLTEWVKPPVSVSALVPKKGLRATIAQFIHNLLPNSLKQLVERYGYDVYEFPDMKRGEPYQNEDGEWIVPFYKSNS